MKVCIFQFDTHKPIRLLPQTKECWLCVTGPRNKRKIQIHQIDNWVGGGKNKSHPSEQGDEPFSNNKIISWERERVIEQTASLTTSVLSGQFLSKIISIQFGLVGIVLFWVRTPWHKIYEGSVTVVQGAARNVAPMSHSNIALKLLPS